MKIYGIVLALLAIVLSYSRPALADQPVSMADVTSDSDDLSEEDIEEAKNLESLIKRMTTIATKTKMNADYVPGIVTVLYGNDMEERGIRTVGEGLTLAPGVLTTDMLATMRGISESLTTGKIKSMVNGIPYNDTLTGEDSPFYMPIEIVDRIEVIRGPGSAIYGKQAFAGVVNVITRTNENMAFASTGRFNDYQGGAVFSKRDDEKRIGVSLSVAGSRKDRSDVLAQRDSLFGTPYQAFSTTPTYVNNGGEIATTNLKVDYKDFTLKGYYNNARKGPGFGLLGVVPPLEDRLDFFSENAALELGWKKEVAANLEVNLRGGYKHYVYERDREYIYPSGFAGLSDGVQQSLYYKEQSLYTGMDINYTKIKNHNILIGTETESVANPGSWRYSNVELNSFTPLPTYTRLTGDQNWLREGIHRDIWGVYVQDQFSVTKKLTLTAGLRRDEYDDIGGKVTPRIAGVYKINSNNIVKIQYAEAFRPPSFSDLYLFNTAIIAGNSKLEFETISAWDAGYIYTTADFTGRLTLFHDTLRDMLKSQVIDGKVTPFNGGGAVTQGVETEIEKRITDSLKFDGNLTYISTKDDDTNTEIKDARRWISNLTGVYQPADQLTFALRWMHVSETFPSSTDQSVRAGYDPVDLVMTLRKFIVKNLTLRVGAMSGMPTIRVDYPRSGRTWWSQLEYKF